MGALVEVLSWLNLAGAEGSCLSGFASEGMSSVFGALLALLYC
jgi:hypothetical protein